MKKLLLLAFAAFAVLAVSCDKTGKQGDKIDNTFKQGDKVYSIKLSATVRDDDSFASTIEFVDEGPLYNEFVREDIGCWGYLGTYTLPSYNYFWWDHYEFESGTAKVSVSGDQIVMVVDGVLSTGEPFYIHAKGPITQ